MGRSAGKSRSLSQAPKVEYQPQKSQPNQLFGQLEHPRARQESATPADLVPAPQRRPSMLSCQHAVARLQGRSAAESQPCRRLSREGVSRRGGLAPRGRGLGRTLAPSLPPATRRPSARRPPVALATVAPRLPEGVPVSPRIPLPTPHCPPIFAWAQRRRDSKKWRSGARRRLRQVGGGGLSGKR